VAAAIARTNLCVGEKQSNQLLKPSRNQRTYFNLLCGHELLTVGDMLRNFCVAPAAKIMEYIACCAFVLLFFVN